LRRKIYPVTALLIVEVLIMPIQGLQNSSQNISSKGMVKYPEKITIYAHYGLWYRTPFVGGYWVTWGAGGHNPDNIVFEYWKRDIYSYTDYPLCGIFDSGEQEIHAWNIRLAKAAGINAFFAEPLPYQGINDYPYSVAFPALIRAAERENFKVAIWVYGRNYAEGDVDRVISEAKKALSDWKDSPAYLRIDGKPVYVLAFFGAYPAWGWFTPEDLTRFKSEVETAIKESIYLIWMMEPWSKFPDAIPISWWSHPAVDAHIRYLGWYDSGRYWFGNFSKEEFKAEYDFDRTKSEAYGKKFIEAICPGFDDRGPGWSGGFVSREDGLLFQRQIDAAKEVGLENVMITNFNDWGEQTEIMPSLTDWNDWTNPYQYLEMVAQLAGKKFFIPEYPVSVSDPIFQYKFQQIKKEFPPTP
jgi:hypothetical protein